jgi:hypothetical protein
MAKFKKHAEETVEVLPTGINVTVDNFEAPEAPPKFTRYMVGTFLDPQTKEWMIAYAHFDPVTKSVDVLQTERVAGNEEVMIERFQIKIGNLGLMSTEDVQSENKVEIY